MEPCKGYSQRGIRECMMAFGSVGSGVFWRFEPNLERLEIIFVETPNLNPKPQIPKP